MAPLPADAGAHLRTVCYVSGNSFVGQPAGLFEKQKLIDVGIHLLIIDAKITHVPSVTFRPGFAQLRESAAGKHIN